MKRIVVLWLALSIHTVTSANTNPDHLCGTQSHGRQVLGVSYYQQALDYQADAAKAAPLTKFYERLQGRWQGELIDTACQRSSSASGVDTARHYLLDDVQTELLANGMLIFRADKHLIRKHEGSSRYRVVSMTPESRFDFAPVEGLSALEFIDSNTMTAVSHYRQRNGTHAMLAGQSAASDLQLSTGGFSNLRERQDTLMLDGNTLLIETHWFVNGYYSGTDRKSVV